MGLSASDMSERAGDGSGTRIFEGIGGLLGVPMSGFHRSSGMVFGNDANDTEGGRDIYHCEIMQSINASRQIEEM